MNKFELTEIAGIVIFAAFAYVAIACMYSVMFQ